MYCQSSPSPCLREMASPTPNPCPLSSSISLASINPSCPPVSFPFPPLYPFSSPPSLPFLHFLSYPSLLLSALPYFHFLLHLPFFSSLLFSYFLFPLLLSFLSLSTLLFFSFCVVSSHIDACCCRLSLISSTREYQLPVAL